jgi:hypothetical protein
MGFMISTKIQLLDKRSVHIGHYIIMQSQMVFMTTNPIIGVIIFAMFWHNVRKQLEISLKPKFELKHCMVGDETHSSKN